MLALLLLYDEPLYAALAGFPFWNGRPLYDHPTWQPLLMLGRAIGKWPGIGLIFILLLRLHARGVYWSAVLGSALAMALVSAEGIWRAVSRVRPINTGGASVFMPLFHGFTGGGREAPSMPSSEAAAAAAIAVVLCRAVPQLAPLWVILALGCAAMRVEAGAHFPGDAWAGLMLGTAAGMVAVRLGPWVQARLARWVPAVAGM